MVAKRIAVIGAGSGFTPLLVHDLACTPELHGSTLVMMDVNAERLELVHRLCSRYLQQQEIDLRLEATTDRRAALQGADFVMITALVGGARSFAEGWEIAESHGVRWAGSHRILYDEAFWVNFYQLRLFEDILRDVLEVCPQAWFLLQANPVLTAMSYLPRKYPQARIVGMCHGYGHVYGIASALGIQPEEVTFEVAGVNHFIWLTDLRQNGQSIIPAIDEWLETKAPEAWETGKNIVIEKNVADLYRSVGAIPIGDTAGAWSSWWPWWHYEGEGAKFHHPRLKQHWMDFLHQHLEKKPEEFKAIAEDPTLDVASALGYGEKRSGEPFNQIIESISLDQQQTVVVNVPNRGYLIEGIPEDFQVELMAKIDGSGIHPLPARPLPEAVLALILRDRVGPVKMEIAAYEQGSRELLVQLLLMDRWVDSYGRAQKLIDDIFALPYHEELREHYR